MTFTENSAAYLLVIAIILAAFAVLGVAAGAGMRIERHFRKRGATRIANWNDHRDRWGKLRAMSVQLRRTLTPPHHRRVPHLPGDPDFIPQWLREATPPAIALTPDDDFIPDHLRVAMLRRQAD